MPKNERIKLNKYQFAELISEVDGLCPICTEELLILDKGNQQVALSQAAHIYPHSPSNEEQELLEGVPKLSENDESIENLIMLCPNCHYKFDHPRTRAGYMEMFKLKQQLIKRRKAKEHYQKHNIEQDIIEILQGICEIDIINDTRKLSYQALTVNTKMSVDASPAVKNIVTRDARDYYLPIRDALVQLEEDAPGKSELIAKEIALFYHELKTKGFSQDEIYYAINDWIDAKTYRQYTFLTPFITAFYIQNCEVFS